MFIVEGGLGLRRFRVSFGESRFGCFLREKARAKPKLRGLSHIGLDCCWGIYKGSLAPYTENQMEKEIQNEMETEGIYDASGLLLRKLS